MKHRRGLVYILIAALPIALLASCATGVSREDRTLASASEPGRWSGDPVVRTRFGLVRGFKDKDDTWVWKAIPYAAPPVGERRWRAPSDPAPWTGVRAQRRFNGGCVQFRPLGGGAVHGSEDCLYLNVWRPQSKEALLPVYVWIHGGGNSIGSATFVKDYYGNRLASRSNMVFVSMNYRLGPMGWFANPALRDGSSPADASGNYGTLDIIKALEWVRDNISAFGGDPASVTIAGESAGGMDVLSLLISPLAHGLFQRAICESGAPVTSSIAQGDAKSNEILARLLVNDGRADNPTDAGSVIARMSPEHIRDYLRTASARKILKAYGDRIAGMIDNPAIFRDGYVLPGNGYDALASGTYSNKVPVLIGSNKEEVKLFLFLSSMTWKSELYAAVAKYGSERWRATGVDQVARELAAAPGQPPVYVYRFDWGAPDNRGSSVLPGNWGRRLGAFHSLEIPFFLGTDTVNGAMNLFLFNRRNEPGRKALSSAIMRYTARFARTGDPNRPGDELPKWEPWLDPNTPRTIIFDARGGRTEIHMASVGLTTEEVTRSIETELSEPLRSETESYLEHSKLP